MLLKFLEHKSISKLYSCLCQQLYIMRKNNKPSILYWGNKLINLSIFCEKIEFLKVAVKCLKNEINSIFNVFSS